MDLFASADSSFYIYVTSEGEVKIKSDSLNPDLLRVFILIKYNGRINHLGDLESVQNRNRQS